MRAMLDVTDVAARRRRAGRREKRLEQEEKELERMKKSPTLHYEPTPPPLPPEEARKIVTLRFETWAERALSRPP